MAFLRTLGVVLVLGLVLAAVGGHRLFIQDRFAAEQVLQDSFTVAAAPRVIVETFNGAVEIVTFPEPRVEARVTKRATGSSEEIAEEALDEIEVSITQVGDTVRVTARRPEQFWQTGQRSAAVHVQVPAEAQLELRTSNGKVEVVGPTRDVSATTSNGPIQVNGSRGELKLTTSNGAIKVEGGRGRVELRTSNGGIHVKTKDALVNARTSNGAIHCEGSLQAGDHHLHSSNGKIIVALPADSQFEVDARTSNGKITSAFDVKLAGKAQKRRLQGQVGNDPRMTLKLETSNGSIDLRRD